MGKQVQRFLQIFKTLDFFSVPFQPAISDNKEFYHRSCIGAFTSLILMILSMVYGIQQIILWQNWQLVPKVTQQYNKYTEAEKEIKSSVSIKITSNVYSFRDHLIVEQSPIDPFDPQNIVLLPLVYSLIDGKKVESIYGNYAQYYNNGTLNLSLKISIMDEVQIIFVSCDTQYLQEGQQCAEQERVDKFFKQAGNEIYVQVFFTQISPDKFEEFKSSKVYGLFIEDKLCTAEAIFMQRTKYDMDLSILFDSPKYKYLFSDATHQTQVASSQFCTKSYPPQIYGLVWIFQQENMSLIRMRYPKIGVFANIGSIISVLFLIKYAIIALNFHQLRDSTLDKISDSYFSDLANCEIITTWYGRIKSISLKGKKIEKNSYNIVNNN